MQRNAFLVAIMFASACDRVFGLGDPRLDAPRLDAPPMGVGVSHVQTTCKDFNALTPGEAVLYLGAPASAGHVLLVSGTCFPAPGGSITFSDDGGNAYSPAKRAGAGQILELASSPLSQPATKVTATYLSGCQGPTLVCATELAHARPPDAASIETNSGSGGGDVTLPQAITPGASDLGYLVFATGRGAIISSPCCTPFWLDASAGDVGVLGTTTPLGASAVIAHVDQDWQAIGVLIALQ